MLLDYGDPADAPIIREGLVLRRNETHNLVDPISNEHVNAKVAVEKSIAPMLRWIRNNDWGFDNSDFFDRRRDLPIFYRLPD